MNQLSRTTGFSAAAPAFLPLHIAVGGAGSPFGAQIRAAIARELKSGSESANGGWLEASRRVPVQQALTHGSGDPAQWAALTRRIGGNYLSSSVGEVFVRQMALESGNFAPDVISGRRVSSAGAEGIAQLMPASYPNVNRLDPVQSLNAAAGTMRDNLLRYSGDLRKALAAYNAGAGAVDNAVARLGSGWEAGLPAETQQYLQLLVGSSAA